MYWADPRLPYSESEERTLFSKLDSRGRRYTTTPLHAPGETMNGPTGGSWRGIKPPEGRHWRVSPKVLDTWDKNELIEWSATGNPRKKVFLDERNGKRVQDIWEFKDPAYSDYPTQKSIELLELIVKASSQPGDLVLDCFCGSGTTLIAANSFERNWIGVDQSDLAIGVSKQRLSNAGANFDIIQL